MISIVIAMTLVFLAMISIIIRNAYKAGQSEKELEVEKHVNDIQEKRDEIAKQPSRTASRLIEWMRSPHSCF
jgi:hypothetical protein